MSIPKTYIEDLLNSLSQKEMKNLIAQTDARRILQEVKESTENYPRFDTELTEKATHIAYTLLSCGCSLVENEDLDFNEGLLLLEKSGKIISDVFRFNINENKDKNYHLLIAGMALYASKQYSQAFIVLKGINLNFSVGQIIINFIKKDFTSLLQITNQVFFTSIADQYNYIALDEWIISHEIARVFFIIIDFIHTGNQESFTQIDFILEKLLALSLEDNLTLYWMIIRLLKIILITFRDASTWSTLLPLFPNNPVINKYIQLLTNFKSPVTEIWPSQIVSLPLAVGDNDGAVINLRTSGGKTRVAEIAILHTLSTNKNSKVLYLAPFRSLAFEIEQCLNKTFYPLNITVSQLYGGATANVTDFELITQSQVIIATPEKAKALIRSGSGIEIDVKLIVIDEGHLLGKEKRYIRNEIFLTHIKEYAYRNRRRILLLSAVLPNANELAQWIANDPSSVASSEWKPALERLGLLIWNGTQVSLEWKSEGNPFNPNFIVKAPLGYSRRRNHFPNTKNEAIAATAVRLAQNGTVMIYSARANSIDSLAKGVLLALGESSPDYAWNSDLWNLFQSICNEELDSNNIILNAAKKGIICHSNKLPSLVRIAIERLMRSKPPLIIIASSTLGQGVNIGISTVIVATPYYSQESINNRDFWNICGRAGRAFSDSEGKILYTIDTTREAWQIQKDKKLVQTYFNNKKMEDVHSGLLYALKLIIHNAKRFNIDINLLIENISNDFINTEIPNNFCSGLNDLLDNLDDEVLAMHEDFSNDDENLTWVDDVFRKSLAIIQAEIVEKDVFLKLIKARTNALINRIKNKSVRKKLIASGVPLSVSLLIYNDIDYFRNLVIDFVPEFYETHDAIKIIDGIVSKLEIWCNKNACCIIEQIPDQTSLDKMRLNWLKGIPLSIIRQSVSEADSISKEYYGFTLPWIIHAISQMFDQQIEVNIINTYNSIALFVELGLPNETAANIYMTGIRSRSISLELSMIQSLQNKTIIGLKQSLLNLLSQDIFISEDAIAWINLLLKFNKEQESLKISFPKFKWNINGLPQKLYLHENNGEFYLTSSDGYFQERVDSSEKLPFTQIANIFGLFFEVSQDNIWQLKSSNPFITINE